MYSLVYTWQIIKLVYFFLVLWNFLLHMVLQVTCIFYFVYLRDFKCSYLIHYFMFHVSGSNGSVWRYSLDVVMRTEDRSQHLDGQRILTLSSDSNMSMVMCLLSIVLWFSSWFFFIWSKYWKRPQLMLSDISLITLKRLNELLCEIVLNLCWVNFC